MALTFKEILEILRTIDASSCQEITLEVGDVKLVVRKKTAEHGQDIPAVEPSGPRTPAAR